MVDVDPSVDEMSVLNLDSCRSVGGSTKTKRFSIQTQTKRQAWTRESQADRKSGLCGLS